jgi:hypothetical protein
LTGNARNLFGAATPNILGAVAETLLDMHRETRIVCGDDRTVGAIASARRQIDAQQRHVARYREARHRWVRYRRQRADRKRCGIRRSYEAGCAGEDGRDRPALLIQHSGQYIRKSAEERAMLLRHLVADCARTETVA